MGFNISWLAFKGCERSSVLKRVGLVANGVVSDYPKGMECGSALPDNGYLLFLNHPKHAFTQPSKLDVLSAECEIVGCQVQEFNTSSAVFYWKNGVRIWSVVHDAEKNIRNLEIIGSPPAELESLRHEANKLQDLERKPFSFFGLGGLRLDHFVDVPIDLATKLVGYNHSKIIQPWGVAKYEILELASLQ